MEIKSSMSGERYIAYLRGEIDHHNAKSAREGLDAIIERDRPTCFALDLSGVSFCDSSGLGLVMGRMKKCNAVGSALVIQNPSEAAMKMLAIAGMDKIIKIERGV